MINFSTSESFSCFAEQHISIGDSEGNLRVLNIPHAFARALPNEKNAMENFYSREVDKTKYIIQRRLENPPKDTENGQGPSEEDHGNVERSQNNETKVQRFQSNAF